MLLFKKFAKFILSLLLVALFAKFFVLNGRPILTGMTIYEEDKCDLSLIGSPSISADEINQLLSEKNSPANGLGQFIFDEGDKRGIDPVFMMAFFKIESQYGTARNKDGTYSIAYRSKSVGNIRYTSSKCSKKVCPQWCDRQNCNDNECFCGYDRWEDGIVHWYNLISGPSYFESNLKTVEEIVPKYANQEENNVEEYIQFIRNFVSKYKSIKESCDENTRKAKLEVEGLNFGVYSITPSFNVKIDYDFDDYKILKEKSVELLKKFDNQKTDLTGLYHYKEKDDGNGIVLGTNSCNDKEKILEILEEELNACYESRNDNCYCDFDMQHLMEEGIYNIEISQEDFSSLKMADENQLNKELKYKIGLVKSISGTNPDVTDEKSFLWELKYKNSQLESSEINLGKDNIKIDSNIQLFKKDKKLSIVKPGLIHNNAQIENKRCRYTKRMFRFCAESDKKLLAHDFESARNGKLPVHYKFSLFFYDYEAPESIELNDVRYDKNTKEVVLNFEPSKEKDIWKYLIYCDESDDEGNFPEQTAKGQFFKDNMFMEHIPENERLNDMINIRLKNCKQSSSFMPGKRYFVWVITEDIFENKDYDNLKYKSVEI